MRKQDEKNDNSTTRSEDGTITQAEVEQWYNQFNDEPMVQEGISPTLYAFSLPHLLQLLQHGLQLLNNSSSSTIHQFTKIQSLSGNDFSLDNSLSDKSIEMKSSHGTTKEDEWIDAMPDADLSCAKGKKGEEPRFEMVQQENGARNVEDEAAGRAKLLQRGLQSPNNSSSSTTHHFTNVGNSSDADLSYAKGKKGEEPRFQLFQQETGARNVEDEAAGRAKLLQRGLQSPNNGSSSTIHQFTNIGSLSNADLSYAKGKKGEEPRFEMFQQETGARNIEDEAAGRAKLLQRGLQSPNNSSSSTTHHFTNVGNSSDADLSYAKGKKGEEPRFEMVQQENGARNVEDEAAGRAKLLPRGLQSPNNSSSSTTLHFTNVGNSSDADLSYAKGKKGEEPRFEMVQQENGARNVEDEAAGRAKLLQRGLQSPNNSSSSTIHQFTNIGSLSDADLSYAKGQKGEEPRFEIFQQETGARNIEDEAAGRAKLLQRGLQSPNNSSSSTIHQFTNIGSLSDADLPYAKGKKGEEPRFEMVQQENGARNIEDEAAGRAKLLPHGLQSPNNSSSSTTLHFTNVGNSSDADFSYAKVQNGEEPRFEMVQQETGARNIEDEAAAGAKLLPHGLQSPNNSSSSTTLHFTNVGNSSDADFSYAKVQNGEEPRFEMVQQETGARNIEDEAAAGAKLLPHGLQSPNNSSSSTTLHFTNVGNSSNADFSYAKVQNGEGSRFEMVQQETGARNIEDEAAAGAKLLPRGLQSPNSSSSSTTHHFTNVGNSSSADFSYAKVQKGEEPRFEKVQQETGARNIEDEAAARAKNGQIFITANRQSIVEPLNCVFPPEERKGIPSSPFYSSGFLKFSEFEAYFDQPADQEKGTRTRRAQFSW
ncbi:uncharacterized protein LOC104452962 [Eucalyptus grandis]|uniref:uncharacterized protein LOC104452962 n=1 Tax=Eucalyptus grandis TaxID=71139 RepID=UPI00192ED0F4|nr:uncharacterized protein LOC104452962 [Eucalyptus grandis]